MPQKKPPRWGLYNRKAFGNRGATPAGSFESMGRAQTENARDGGLSKGEQIGILRSEPAFDATKFFKGEIFSGGKTSAHIG